MGLPAKLNMAQFLGRVWPSEGPYCLMYVDVVKGVLTKCHSTRPDIPSFVQLARGKSSKTDVYFAVHTLKEGKLLDDQGRMRTRRIHENMREAKCVFFDIDVGEAEGKYPSFEAAWAALEQFVFMTCLPAPLVVSSGGGLHVYWTWTTPLDSDAWAHVADRMCHLARRYGLRVDPPRTRDRASVLRVVGTDNYKTNPPAMVRCIAAGVETPTAEFIASVESLTQDYRALSSLSRGSRASAGAAGSYDGRITPIEEIYAVCEHMRTWRDAVGTKALSEGQWYDGIGVMAFAHEGLDEVHRVSPNDERYDADETNRKIKQWLDNANVTTCAKLEAEFGGDACARCPFHGGGKGRNPLAIANKVWVNQRLQPDEHIAEKVKPATATPAPPPGPPVETDIPPRPCQPAHPYSLTKGGVVKSVKDGDDYVDMNLLHRELYPLRSLEPQGGEPGFSDWCVAPGLKGRKFETFPVTNVELCDARLLDRKLSDAGVVVTGKIEDMRGYMRGYLSELHTTLGREKTFDYLGWHYVNEVDGKSFDAGSEGATLRRAGFVLYKRYYNCATQAWSNCGMAQSIESELDKVMCSMGSMDAQIEALRFFDKPQHFRTQFMVLLSVITPFFVATGENGVAITASGKTGGGKTLALAASAGIWGQPKRLMTSGLASGSTTGFRTEMMAVFANIPVFFDELTSAEPQAIKEIVLSVTQPGGKGGLKRDRSFRPGKGGVRSSLLLATTNDSWDQKLDAADSGGQAALARLIQINFPQGADVKVMADRARRGLEDNYGHIGLAVLKKALPDTGAIIAEIQQVLDDLNVKWDTLPHERFWTAVIAPLLVVGRIAFRAGYIPFDPDKVVDEWFIPEMLPKLRRVYDDQATKSAPNEVIAMYTREIAGETVRVGVDEAGETRYVGDVPRGRISARYDTHSKELWIASSAFVTWCNRRSYDSESIMADLRSKGALLAGDRSATGGSRKTLTLGLNGHDPVRVRCYALDAAHDYLAGVVKESA